MEQDTQKDPAADPELRRQQVLTELRQKLGAIAKLEPPPGWSVGGFLRTTHSPSLPSSASEASTEVEEGRGEKNLREKTQREKTEPPNPERKKSLILPRGALVEWMGENAEAALCGFFQQYPDTRIAWVEKKLRIFPPAFAQRGVSLKRILFLESEKNWLWGVEQCIRSGQFQFVVMSQEDLPSVSLDVFLRKIQLLSERSRSTVCLVARTPISSYSIRHRLEVDPPPSSLSPKSSSAKVLESGL